MKIEHILGSGCSFVKNGWVYEKGQKENWTETDMFTQNPTDFPRMVGENLGLPAHNIAKPGSGVQYNIHSVHLWVKNNRDKVENTLLLFGITALQRGTFFTKAQFPNMMENDGIPDDFPNHLTPNYHIPEKEKEFNYWRSRGYDPKEIVEFFTLYYKIAHNYFHWMNWQRHQLSMFQAWLNSIGLRHVFINTLATSKNHREDLSFLENKFTFPDGIDNWIEYIDTYNFRSRELHPTVYDHKKLAELLTSYIKEKYEV